MDMKNSDVKDLLQDINSFLFDTMKNEHLSSKAKTEYDQLVQRLSLLEPVNEYTDMSGSMKHPLAEEYVATNTSQEANVDCKLYEEFPEIQMFNNSESQDSYFSISIEHLILPASKLRAVGKKFGALSRKERFMGLFAERSIRCYMGLLGHYLYVYNSDRDAKPATFINIQGFEARPAVTSFPKDSKKKYFFFEIVCPGKKSYQFMASNFQEMEQWINCINEAGALVNETKDNENSPKTLPSNLSKFSSSPSDLRNMEEYDDIRGHHDDKKGKIKEYSDENYYNIKDIGLINEEQMVPTVPTTEQLGDLKKNSDKESELVYDDIYPVDPDLYYNISDQKVQKIFDSDLSSKRTFSLDEEVYDDIGVLLNNAAVQYCNHLHTSNNKSIIVQKHVFSEVISDVTDSGLDKSICSDNLYEPVENPRED